MLHDGRFRLVQQLTSKASAGWEISDAHNVVNADETIKSYGEDSII